MTGPATTAVNGLLEWALANVEGASFVQVTGNVLLPCLACLGSHEATLAPDGKMWCGGTAYDFAELAQRRGYDVPRFERAERPAGSTAGFGMVDAENRRGGPASGAWPDPTPLPEGLPPVVAFDLALLPEAFRDWIDDVAERLQCPPDYPAVAAMVAVAAVVGRKVGIRPKEHDDWVVVPNLWGGVVGRPGLLKTPAMAEPLRPLQRLEIGARQEHEAAEHGWEASRRVAKERAHVDAQNIRRALKDGGDANAIAREALAGEEDRPQRRRYFTSDTTVEALGVLLAANPRGILIYRDELVGFLRSLDREGHEGARAFYLEAWNGSGRFTFDRIGRGTVDIEAACVSILGSIQPGVIAEYVAAAARGGAGDDGLLQRFQLLVWPDPSSEWRDVDRWPDTKARQTAYAVFERLDRLDPREIGACMDDGDIPYLRFAPDAQETFREWRAGLEKRLRTGDEHPAVEAHLSKYRSLLPALALLIHLADVGHGPVGLTAMLRAGAWADFLESHARRVYAPALAPDMEAARALAAKIKRGALPGRFALRDVYRACWAGVPTREQARTAVDVLLDHHWLREAAETSTGGRPSVTYLLHPKLPRRESP